MSEEDGTWEGVLEWMERMTSRGGPTPGAFRLGRDGTCTPINLCEPDDIYRDRERLIDEARD